jgi:hypothetical protein
MDQFPAGMTGTAAAQMDVRPVGAGGGQAADREGGVMMVPPVRH